MSESIARDYEELSRMFESYGEGSGNRIVTTVEELEALPAYSIVLTGRSTCWTKSKSGEFCWESTAGHMGSTSKGLPLPATILWESSS